MADEVHNVRAPNVGGNLENDFKCIKLKRTLTTAIMENLLNQLFVLNLNH